MDVLAGLLDGPRARGAFVMRSVLDPPWALRIQDRAPLTVVAVVRGQAWAIPDSGAAVALGAWDVAIFRGPDPYTVADDPDTTPQVIVHPGQITARPDGEVLCAAMSLGVRSWGTGPDGAAVLMTGTYEVAGAVSDRLLRALPPLAVVPRASLDDRLIDFLVDEAAKDDPGQGSVLDRLLDLVLISAVRAWFADNSAPAWYHAYGDPLVGKAIRIMQHNPEQPWTVASLAVAVGSSRAALARRFTDLVGEPPMAFLTEWRLSLAADLFRASDATVESVARQVGYGSAFALSAAFKRHYGISPREHRLGTAS